MLKLEIATDNASFFDTANDDFNEEAKRIEVARILRQIARKIEHDYATAEGAILDINGNKVGRWSLD